MHLIFRELKDPLFNAESFDKISTFLKVNPKLTFLQLSIIFQRDKQKEREGRRDELKDLFEGMALEKR